MQELPPESEKDVSSFNVDYAGRADWITIFDTPFYPDYLSERVVLHKPTWIEFRRMVKESDNSANLFRLISEETGKDRVQLCRFFRRFVSPDTSVEMLKRKTKAEETIKNFGDRFRPIEAVKEAVRERPEDDVPLFAILGEYDNRGQKGYDLTEVFFDWFEARFEEDPELTVEGPKGAGKDPLLSNLLEAFEHDTPVDFVIEYESRVVAVGFARYDSDRGGSQEDDRPGGNERTARLLTQYEGPEGIPIKVVFLNDGPGLLLGSMWKDYVRLEKINSEQIMVCTLKMLDHRLTKDWLLEQ